MRLRIGLIILLVMLWVGMRAYAWSYKEHIQLTRIAVGRLIADPTTPSAMRDWLRQAVAQPLDMAGEREFLLNAHVGPKPGGFDGMLYWAYEPDVRATSDPRDSRVAPFNVHERLLHFIDLELFQPPAKKKGYRHDLSGKPSIEQVPHDMTDPRYQQAGMLPLRIEQCYGELVRAIRENRLHAPTVEEQESQKTATYWAGLLSHYLADNTQPQHATLDYKSQTYFANKRKAPNVHSEVEYRMVDDEKEHFPQLREEYWKLFERALNEDRDPIETADPFRASVEVSMISYDALPFIGEAAMRAAGQQGTPDDPHGDIAGAFDTDAFMRCRGTFRGQEMSVMEMKAHQTAWAVKRIERTLRQAWKDARG